MRVRSSGIMPVSYLKRGALPLFVAVPILGTQPAHEIAGKSDVTRGRQKAERLAKLSVQDPILYAIERRREANELNDTKVGGFGRRAGCDWAEIPCALLLHVGRTVTKTREPQECLNVLKGKRRNPVPGSVASPCLPFGALVCVSVLLLSSLVAREFRRLTIIRAGYILRSVVFPSIIFRLLGVRNENSCADCPTARCLRRGAYGEVPAVWPPHPPLNTTPLHSQAGSWFSQPMCCFTYPVKNIDRIVFAYTKSVLQ